MLKNKVFFQIGTNDGFDVFRDLVIEFQPSQIILVEPNKKLNPSIHKNYKNIPNYNIINKAITLKNEPVKLYYPALNKDPRNVSENGIHYCDFNYSLIPMNDWGSKNNMIELEAEGITFNKLCEDMKIRHINFLSIDAEGFDGEIIQSINFEKIKIDVIKYEYWNYPSEEFTRYHKDFEKYGINGMKNTENFLKSHGYNVEHKIDDDGHNIIASPQLV